MRAEFSKILSHCKAGNDSEALQINEKNVFLRLSPALMTTNRNCVACLFSNE